jgi:hypothetical protein
MGAALGIDPDSRNRPTGRGIGEGADLVVSRLAELVGRGILTVRDVGDDEQGLMTALEGQPGGFLSRLDPGRAYRCRVYVLAVGYDGNEKRGTVSAQDVLGADLPGALASAVYHVLEGGDSSWSMYGASAPGDSEVQAVDMLTVEVEVYALPASSAA